MIGKVIAVVVFSGASTLLALVGWAGVDSAELGLLRKHRLELVHFQRHLDESYRDMRFEPTAPMPFACSETRREQARSLYIPLTLGVGNTVLGLSGVYSRLWCRWGRPSDAAMVCVMCATPLVSSLLWRTGCKMRQWYRQARFRQLRRARIHIVPASPWNEHVYLLVSENLALWSCLHRAFVQCAQRKHWTVPEAPIESCWFYLDGRRLSHAQLTQPLRRTLQELSFLAGVQERTLVLTIADGRIPTFLMGFHPRLGAASTLRTLQRLDRRVLKRLLTFVV